MRRTIEIPDDTIQFERTPRDAGVECSLKLTRYDRPGGAQWAINGKVIGGGALDVATLLAATVEAMEKEGP